MDMTPGIRTFIVEDNATIRENLIDTLEELAQIRMVGVAEGERESCSWLAAHAHRWDLAIVDLFLKQGSGLGVLSACKERLPHQRVVVLSNYATPDVRTRCLKLGADAVFDKSNDIDALLDYCIAYARQTPWTTADLDPSALSA
ncbi:response regulator [Xylophilus sp. ASV27]|uniref:response regulator n=1 Tax=Xylophilus sp. ASV27 TaxID=2795129 RepID=UPI001E58190F|nr:response regulator transcription factor [Xylophilus sp. ASV27]